MRIVYYVGNINSNGRLVTNANRFTFVVSVGGRGHIERTVSVVQCSASVIHHHPGCRKERITFTRRNWRSRLSAMTVR